MSKEQLETESKKGAGKAKLKLADLDEALENTTAKDRPGLLCNSYTVQEGKQQFSYPIPPAEIWERMKELTDNAVKRDKNELFMVMKNSDIVRIRKVAALFGNLFNFGIDIQWSDKVKGAISKAEFQEYCLSVADYYDMIAEYPTYPKTEGVFCRQDIEPKSTGKLDQLIDFFTPASDDDRLLLKAAFCTVLWGKSGGKKPAFVFDGEDTNHVDGKKGIGKSTVIEVMSQLVEEIYIDLDHRAELEVMKTRILKASGRVIRYDNIKTGVLNSEAIENLVTSEFISGHDMYNGQKGIPNHFMYCLTFNDANMSKDLAQRSVLIKMKRPAYDPTWSDRLKSFLDEFRKEVIADIGWHLCVKQGANGSTKTRFAKWEREVLWKVAAPELGEVVKERQMLSDDEVGLVKEIREFIADKISEYEEPFESVKINPDEAVVAVKTTILHGWLKEMMGKNYSERGVKKRLASNRPEELGREEHKIGGMRFYVWNSPGPENGHGAQKPAFKIDDKGGVIKKATAWQREKSTGARKQGPNGSFRDPQNQQLLY